MAETYTPMEFSKVSWLTTKASCLTGVPLKQVHRIIDAGLLGAAAKSRNSAQVVLGLGLIGLKLAYELGTVLTPEGRRRLIWRLLDEPTVEAVHDEPLSVDVRLMAVAVRRRISLLAEAKQMVETDDGLLGGRPCFKATQFPVHDIAAMVANGESVAAFKAAYSRLTEAHLSVAPTYAQAYLRRGRRRKTDPSRRPEQFFQLSSVRYP